MWSLLVLRCSFCWLRDWLSYNQSLRAWSLLLLSILLFLKLLLALSLRLLTYFLAILACFVAASSFVPLLFFLPPFFCIPPATGSSFPTFTLPLRAARRCRMGCCWGKVVYTYNPDPGMNVFLAENNSYGFAEYYFSRKMKFFFVCFKRVVREAESCLSIVQSCDLYCDSHLVDPLV